MKESQGAQEHRVGAHLLRFEPPDLYHITLVGDLSMAELTALGDIVAPVERSQQIFVLADMRRFGTLSPGVRKVEMYHYPGPHAVAFVGASFTARVVTTLLSKAFRVLHPETKRRSAFFDTEAEGRAFLDTIRRASADGAGDDAAR